MIIIINIATIIIPSSFMFTCLNYCISNEVIIGEEINNLFIDSELNLYLINFLYKILINLYSL